MQKILFVSLLSVLVFIGTNEVFAQGAGTALNFDGSNEYINCGSNSSILITNLNPRTVEAWVSHATDDGNIIGWGGDVCIGDYFGLHIDQGKPFAFGCGASSDLSGTIVLSSNIYYHIALTFTENQKILYVNGEVDTSNTVTANTGSVNPVEIGKQTGPLQNYFAGKIEEVRIWNVVRTQTQIRDNMNKRLTGSESNLKGYWRFDEGSGDTAYDATSNNNKGALKYMEPADWVT